MAGARTRTAGGAPQPDRGPEERGATAPGERPGELRAALAEHREEPEDAVEALGAPRPGRRPVRAHLEILEHAQRGEHLAALGHVRDAEPRAHVRRPPRDVLAAVLDPPARRQHAAADGLEQRRLARAVRPHDGDRKSTRLNSSHGYISYAVFCLKKQNT